MLMRTNECDKICHRYHVAPIIPAQISDNFFLFQHSALLWYSWTQTINNMNCIECWNRMSIFFNLYNDANNTTITSCYSNSIDLIADLNIVML